MVKDKVVVVTGAGRGIGRAIALMFAQYGAKVVVNDPGGSPDGQGGDQMVAEQVVDEIKKAGGEAVPSFDSVDSLPGATRIIETAIQNYGRIDVVVNNAGILRDRILFKMSEEEFDDVIRVHVKGAWSMTRAAAPYMRDQKFGRIINFTSTTGLIGQVGQVNYGTAKAGIVGLTKNTALDMAKYNVTANVICPFAYTRLVGTIESDDPVIQARIEKFKKMTPEKIAPLVVYLASDQAQEVSGQIFAVRGNELVLFSQIRPIRNVVQNTGWTAEEIAETFIPAVKSSFYKLDISNDVFPYDPLV
ncbi:MAG TPA: SDR family NAD(P)-dependent oxidoreductase [Syntrophomonas sp.]|nr:SDR family NAD(P)-dependent oxidoreductase [Syntrophomonas sp.]